MGIQTVQTQRTQDRICVALDCEQTLFYTRFGSSVPGVPVQHIYGDAVQVIVRPSALPFLTSLRERSALMFGLSGGKSSKMNLSMHFAGLSDLVPNVMGSDRQRNRHLPQDWRWVLIDDGAPRGAVAEKLYCLGGKRQSDFTEDGWKAFLAEHFIQCSPFTGGADDRPLTDHLADVLNKLGLSG